MVVVCIHSFSSCDFADFSLPDSFFMVSRRCYLRKGKENERRYEISFLQRKTNIQLL